MPTHGNASAFPRPKPKVSFKEQTHAELNSSAPGRALMWANVDREDSRHAEAVAIVEGWRPTLKVVCLPASDHVWQRAGEWHQPDYMYQPRGPDGGREEPAFREGVMAAGLKSVKAMDFERETEDRAKALVAIDYDSVFDVPALEEAEAEVDTDVVEAAPARRPKVTTSREQLDWKKNGWWKEIAGRYPHLRAGEGDLLLEGILRYGVYICEGKRLSLILKTGQADDAAQQLVMKAKEMMDAGEYEHQPTPEHPHGKFRGWLSKVFRNHVQGDVLKQLEDERDDLVGIQDWDGKDGESVEAGRVFLPDDEVEDRASDYKEKLKERAAKLNLEPWDIELARAASSTESDGEAAVELGIPLRTYQRRWAALRDRVTPGRQAAMQERTAFNAEARAMREERKKKKEEREKQTEQLRERIAGVLRIEAAEDDEKYPSFAELAARVGVELEVA